jgi:HK97 family phage prohead protease
MGYAAANEQMGMQLRDVWTTAYINDLPDSAFLYIAPGGTKTDGKTDGAHRFFPVRGADGKPDAAHIRNAMARIPQASSIPAAARMAAMAKAKAMAGAHPDIGSGPMMGYEGAAGSGRSYEPEPALECRSFDVVVHLRADGDGRTLVGRAVPYGVSTELPGGGTERFVPGAFAKQLSPAAADQLQRVKLYASHSDRLAGQQPIGRTALLMDRPDGLHGEWPLYNTIKASDSLELVRTGEITGLSIGFKALSSRPGADGATERHSAHLDHVTLTHEPVYDGAAVLAVRAGAAVAAARPVATWRGELLKAQGILARLATGG